MLKLTPKERRVLYGLVRWPELNDYGLSESLGLGRSTVTVVRQRLEGKGLVKSVLLPDFRRLGCELLTALYGEYGGAGGKVKASGSGLQDGVSTVFYMVRSGGLHLSFGAARNLTRVWEQIREHHRIHHESGYLTDRRHNYVFFPLELSSVHRFFDYAPLLAAHFGIPHEAAASSSGGAGEWRPTRRELSAFKALVGHPEASDELVGKEAGVSRQTVNALRNRFLEEGLLRKLRVPDVAKLGFGLLAFTHLHLSPHHTQEGRRPHVDFVLEDSAHVLKVSGDLESVVLSVYPDYGCFRRSQERMVEAYRRNGLLSDEPVVRLFPLDQTDRVVEHDYANLVSGF